jgi:hypothetical protein
MTTYDYENLTITNSHASKDYSDWDRAELTGEEDLLIELTPKLIDKRYIFRSREVHPFVMTCKLSEFTSVNDDRVAHLVVAYHSFTATLSNRLNMNEIARLYDRSAPLIRTYKRKILSMAVARYLNRDYVQHHLTTFTN